MAVYRLFWDEFSSWYLEMIKPNYGSPIDRATYDMTLKFFNDLLKMLHPFMPFITEELWQHIYERKEGESIMRDCLSIPASTKEDEELVADIENVKQIISNIRTIRNQKNISPKEGLELLAISENKYAEYDDITKKMANLKSINVAEGKSSDMIQFMVGTEEYAVPVGNLIDVEAEIEKQEAQLKHLEGFLAGVMKSFQTKSLWLMHLKLLWLLKERSSMILKKRLHY